jgi:TolB protein
VLVISVGTLVLSACASTSGDRAELAAPNDGSQIRATVAARLVFGSAGGLFTMSTNGSHLTQLTRNVSGVDAQPAFAPDNQRVAFQRNVGVYPHNHSYLVVKSLTTDAATRVSSRDLAWPSWSPSGRRIVAVDLSRPNRYRLAVIAARAGRVHWLGATGYLQNQPSWAPNGQTIVFSGKQKSTNSVPAAIMSITPRGTRQHLLFRGEHPSTSPSWSPDGRHIVFIQMGPQRPQQVPSGHITTMRPNGSHVRVVLGGHVRAFRPAYTPNGRWIVFQRGTAGTAWAIRPTGLGLHRISATEAFDPDPTN